jgi:hypothetical protein
MPPKLGRPPVGPVTAAAWITHRDDPYETLCYGTILGYLVFVRQSSRDVRISAFEPHFNVLTQID